MVNSFSILFSNEEIKHVLKSYNVNFFQPENLSEYVAKKLNNQKIIGWFQGGAEFGPRALGNRSILTAPFPKEIPGERGRSIMDDLIIGGSAAILINEVTEN